MNKTTYRTFVELACHIVGEYLVHWPVTRSGVPTAACADIIGHAGRPVSRTAEGTETAWDKKGHIRFLTIWSWSKILWSCSPCNTSYSMSWTRSNKCLKNNLQHRPPQDTEMWAQTRFHILHIKTSCASFMAFHIFRSEKCSQCLINSSKNYNVVNSPLAFNVP